MTAPPRPKIHNLHRLVAAGSLTDPAPRRWRPPTALGRILALTAWGLLAFVAFVAWRAFA